MLTEMSEGPVCFHALLMSGWKRASAASATPRSVWLVVDRRVLRSGRGRATSNGERRAAASDEQRRATSSRPFAVVGYLITDTSDYSSGASL